MRIVYDEDYDYYENLMCKPFAILLKFILYLSRTFSSGHGDRPDGQYPARHELAFDARWSGQQLPAWVDFINF